MGMLWHWFMAFALTVVVELAVAVPLLGAIDTPWRRAAAVCFAQLATHPAVWFIWPLFGLQRLSYLLVAEGFALVTEALFYRFAFKTLPWPRALAASALANGASLILGLWLH